MKRLKLPRINMRRRKRTITLQTPELAIEWYTEGTLKQMDEYIRRKMMTEAERRMNEMEGKELAAVQMQHDTFVELITKAAGKRRYFKDFMEWLESTDFFRAPASTKYHGCEEGGLVQHSLNVCWRLLDRNDLKCSWETAVIASLLHDVCKVDTYLPAAQEDGIITEWRYNNSKKLPIGHSERSIILIQQTGMTLTLEEIVAIRWHMGAFDKASCGGSKEMSEAFRQYPLAVQLHLADMEATYLDEGRKV